MNSRDTKTTKMTHECITCEHIFDDKPCKGMPLWVEKCVNYKEVKHGNKSK